MAPQQALTIVARIKREEKAALKQLLEAMGKNPAHNALLPWARLTGTHFARLFILDEDVDLQGAPLPPYLVLLSDFDGSTNNYLIDLVDASGDNLDQIYCHCEGYPSSSTITPRQRLGYLRKHSVSSAANYVNTSGRTVEQVLQESQLREAIQYFLDCNRHLWGQKDPLAIRAAVQEFVASERSLRWALKPAAGPTLLSQIGEGLDLVRLPVKLLALSPILLTVLPFWVVALRYHELTDAAPDVPPDDGHVRELAALEDHAVQNPFTAVGFLKPGWFRLATSQTILTLIQYAARHIYTHASLAGVKTIHFARWVFLDDHRRVFFASNYDGSLSAYNDDFINIVAYGLNAIFSHGVGYPRTNWLVLDGAWDEAAFKRYIRTHQVPTPVWYSAYPALTAANIGNNAQVRVGLTGKMDVKAGLQWLRRL